MLEITVGYVAGAIAAGIFLGKKSKFFLTLGRWEC